MKKLIVVVVILVIAAGAAYMLVKPRLGGAPMSPDKAAARLSSLLKKVDWSENFVQRRAQVQLADAQDLTQMLPNIDQFPIANQLQPSSNDVVVEIFTSTEKSGTGTDG